MKLKRYCVTIMDNWTPMREFWTLWGARKFKARHSSAYLFVWDSGKWREYNDYNGFP